MLMTIIAGAGLIALAYGSVHLMMLSHKKRQDKRLKRQLKHYRDRARYKKYLI